MNWSWTSQELVKNQPIYSQDLLKNKSRTGHALVKKQLGTRRKTSVQRCPQL